MKIKPLSLALASIYLAAPQIATAEEASQLQTVEVTSDFRTQSLDTTPASVSVVDEITIQKRNARGLDDLMTAEANVNASSGASNANFFQIRGIGERSQFQTAINPSVGVLVDDFDYSRMGAAATMFDVESVEVLRGPQGTAFGSSALAGLVKIKSKEASEETQARVQATIGSHNTKAIGAAVGGTLIDNTLLGRIAVHKHTSDGYIENTHLDKTDTQNEDELTARGNLKWMVNSKLDIDVKFLHINIDNGYDAFNFDNDYTTISDEPGRDKLKTNAVAVKANYEVSPESDMQLTVTNSNTDTEYSYDEDWTYAGYDTASGYIAFDTFKRERQNRSMDLRFMSSEKGRIFNGSTDWVAGVYFLGQEEELDRKKTSTYGNKDHGYEYDTTNSSAYGQMDHHLSAATKITAGLRVEQFEADIKTSDGFSKSTSETLYGGKLGLSHQINPNHLGFVSVAKGYKSGGANNSAGLSNDKLTYDTESLWSAEAGVNSDLMQGDLKTRVNAFYTVRQDMQISSNYQNPTSKEFYIYMDNANEGRNYGLEGQLDWLMSDTFRLMSSLGLLQTEFVNYTYSGGQWDSDNELDGRPQAHAPSYQFSIGGEYYATNELTISANVEGKDAFYYSNSHNESSDAYELINASVEYALKNWTVTAWGRNLADKEYDTRGFYFGNDPKDGWTSHNYTQKGEPRTFGVTVSYDY